MREQIRKLLILSGWLLIAAACLLCFPVRAFADERDGGGFKNTDLYETLEEAFGPSARTLDGEILLEWEADKADEIRYFRVQVSAGDGKCFFSFKLPADARSFTFDTGKHGKCYHIALFMSDSVGTETEILSCERMFLNFSEMPDLPVVEIHTDSGKNPQFAEAVKPDESLPGATITDNEYIPGELQIRVGGNVTDYGKMEIRARGNTSAVLRNRTPYKIKLEEKADLLGREGSAYKDKHWVLLNSPLELNSEVGFVFGEAMGFDWTPHFMFVNVIMNDDYRGIYILAENVRRGETRVDIKKDGFIIENDAYYWNEDVYFQTDALGSRCGYTFKYPDVTPEAGEYIESVRKYMNKVDGMILDANPELGNYIDMESFARWMLFHDILGSRDPAGSNIFLNIKSFDPEDPTKYKLKMGPVWDLETAFGSGEGYSALHLQTTHLLSKLFLSDEFKKAYRNEWKKISGDCEDMLLDALHSFDGQADAISKSRVLTRERTGERSLPVGEEVKRLEKVIKARVEFMRAELGK